MIPILNIELLPSISGLYLVKNEAGEVVYIGQAENIYARWRKGHHRVIDIIKCCGENCTISWVPVSIEWLNLAERQAIKFYNPILNKRLPSLVNVTNIRRKTS